MKANKYKLLAFCLMTWIGSSCSSGAVEEEEPQPTEPTLLPIALQCGISAPTRATDTGYESGDKVGIFVVNYDGDTPGSLSLNGNQVDNMSFTYTNHVWTPASEVYWKDRETPADFYCYYPYTALTDVTAHAFSIRTNQSTPTDYKASEFLYGKATRVSPTEKAVNIMTQHLLSCAVITVAPGGGYTEESLEAANISVRLNGCKSNALINLAEGTVNATGEASSILPLKEAKTYKALVVPQTVQAEDFITVTVDGQEYNLQKEFTFVSGQRHRFTVTVTKISNGVNVGISAWEDDETDNGGKAE